MRYIPNTAAQQREMLATIGVDSIEDLLARVPARARLTRPLDLPAASAEPELIRHLRGLAAANADADAYVCFLGAGSYDHAIPSASFAMVLAVAGTMVVCGLAKPPYWPRTVMKTRAGCRSVGGTGRDPFIQSPGGD